MKQLGFLLTLPAFFFLASCGALSTDYCPECPQGTKCVKRDNQFVCVNNSDNTDIPLGCGNNVIDEGEECDGSNLNGLFSCPDGLDGILSCDSKCKYAGCKVTDRICKDNRDFCKDETTVYRGCDKGQPARYTDSCSADSSAPFCISTAKGAKCGCKPGSLLCQNFKEYVCNDNGDWSFKKNCGATESCNLSTGKCEFDDEYCVNKEELRCVKNLGYQCTDVYGSRLEWRQQRECKFYEVCKIDPKMDKFYCGCQTEYMNVCAQKCVYDNTNLNCGCGSCRSDEQCVMTQKEEGLYKYSCKKVAESVPKCKDNEILCNNVCTDPSQNATCGHCLAECVGKEQCTDVNGIYLCKVPETV